MQDIDIDLDFILFGLTKDEFVEKLKEDGELK